MAVVAQRRDPTGLVDWALRPELHHRLVAAAIAVGGVAVAVLVGHDGTPGWQFVRVAAVAIVTLAVIAVQTRLSDRGCGRLAVAVGVVVLAIGAGFIPYVVKDRWSLDAVAGTVALVAGLALAATGTMIGTRGQRAVWRIAAGLGTVVVTALVAFVVAPAVAATNVPRPEIGATPASKG